MFCKNCGSEIPDGSIFCADCGKDLSGGYVQQQQIKQHPPKKNDDNKKLVMWIVLALLLAAIIVLVLIFVVLPATKDNGNADKFADSQTDEQEDEPEETPIQTEESTSVPTEAPTEAPAPTVEPLPTKEASSLAGTGFANGDTIYDFAVPLIDGGEFVLSQNLDKPVFINAFATWCGPCVGEMPYIQQLYKDYGDQVNFIIIDLGEEMQTVQDFVSDNGYTLPFAYSLTGEVWQEYFIEYIPQSFVVTTDGTIVQFFPGGSDYESFESAVKDAIEASQ